jgi:hypothetical protein
MAASKFARETKHSFKSMGDTKCNFVTRAKIPSREDIADVTVNRAVVEGKKPPLIRKKQDKDAA